MSTPIDRAAFRVMLRSLLGACIAVQEKDREEDREACRAAFAAVEQAYSVALDGDAINRDLVEATLDYMPRVKGSPGSLEAEHRMVVAYHALKR